MASLLELHQFASLLRSGKVRPEVTYSFVGRYTANLAADLIRQESTYVVLWVGPQQFEVR